MCVMIHPLASVDILRVFMQEQHVMHCQLVLIRLEFALHSAGSSVNTCDNVTFPARKAKSKKGNPLKLNKI